MFGELLHITASQGRRLRAARPAPDDAERLAGGYRALGEPTRLSLALALRDGGELCVCDLSWIAERPENLVSHHLRALRSAGLAESRRDGKMVMYSLSERGRSLLAATLSEERVGA